MKQQHVHEFSQSDTTKNNPRRHDCNSKLKHYARPSQQQDAGPERKPCQISASSHQWLPSELSHQTLPPPAHNSIRLLFIGRCAFRALFCLIGNSNIIWRNAVLVLLIALPVVGNSTTLSQDLEPCVRSNSHVNFNGADGDLRRRILASTPGLRAAGDCTWHRHLGEVARFVSVEVRAAGESRVIPKLREARRICRVGWMPGLIDHSVCLLYNLLKIEVDLFGWIELQPFADAEQRRETGRSWKAENVRRIAGCCAFFEFMNSHVDLTVKVVSMHRIYGD